MNNRRESLPSAAWGKRSAEDDWLPLSDHMADVAACFSALIRIPLFRERLACALGRTPDLVTEARLAALAYLHDLGKLSSTFQARMLDPSIRAGHTTEGWHLFSARMQQSTSPAPSRCR